MVKKFLIGIGAVVATVTVSILGYLGYLTIKDYRPEEFVKVDVKEKADEKVKLGNDITIVTSNVGYGGMDRDVHFFMDGGTMSRGISKERVVENIKKATDTIKGENADIVMLQEVDFEATRSYKVNEYDLIKDGFSGFSSSYGINFDVPWLALPLAKPHGQVKAGQVNLSNKKVLTSERIALPIDEKWPTRLAGLDRMLLVSRVEVENGKELVLINLHLSAYDKGGEIRKLQLEKVEKILKEEREKGNYIVVGGDWNQAIPGSDASQFKTEEQWPDWLVELPETFKPEGYSWAFDKDSPTCRNAGKEYIEGYNFLSIIDGFMLSDNIEVKETKAIETAFDYSDHNPVKMIFQLKA